MIQLTDSSFKKEVLDSSVPVLVDFWAPWCGPCKMIAPVLEEMSKEYEGRLKFTKVNVDDCGKTAQEFGIMSIPTVMFFKGGKVMDQSVGALSRNDLKRKIEENL